jgi:ArsR family transcriptional regulator
MRCGPEQTDLPLPDGHDAGEALARLCKALGHPARVHIVRFLIEKDVCMAGEIADEIPLAASTVSQHLKLLKDAGLIRGEIDGPRRNYCVDKGQLGLLKALIAGL